MTVEISDPDIWDKVEKGELTGFSMGGKGKYLLPLALLYLKGLQTGHQTLSLKIIMVYLVGLVLILRMER